LGLFISSHPLNGFERLLEKRATSIAKLSGNGFRRNARVKIGGIISNIKRIITRTGKPMLFVNVEDLSSKMEVIVFPSIIARNPSIFQENKIVMVSGRLDAKDGIQKIICEEIEEIVES
ncbi:MAG: DNA polymerase III subunit alpha, partial [Candidatus Nealsonbacteria bacterium]|nr:DNA polymerase III subunit alpha [Candidatus Nealsonbacteria bacterium]